MPVFKGQGSGDIYSEYFNIPYKIISFYIVNPETKEPFPSVTVYIQDIDENDVPISARAFTLLGHQAYVRDTITKVNKNERIHISTSQTIDYYFSIE
jgi:hypothetical protein